MQYSYIAVSVAGVKQKGLLEANSEKEVIEYLRNSGLTPVTIRVEQKKGLAIFDMFTKTKGSDVVLFTRQLASMSATGLTLIESLTILKDQTTKAHLKSVLLDLIASISGGSSFSQALALHRDVFSDVYIALIKAAEQGGLMDKVLARLADNLERSEDMKKKVRSAMFYPAIVIAGVVIVIVIMNLFVIPQLSTLYEGLHVKLPITTRLVLGMSKGFITFSPIALVLIVVLIFMYSRFKKTPRGIEIIDKIKLKIPIVGSILILAVEDEICRTLSLLISSGTSILESLTITANVANNFKYKQAMLTTANLVEKGVNLSVAFEQQNVFPPIMVQMAKVGESTGKIDESLGKVADYFERDLDLKIKTLTTAIEPILLVFLGATVGFLIISVITPIYSLISAIQ